MLKLLCLLLLPASALVAVLCWLPNWSSVGKAVPIETVEIVQTYPHDSQAFTQGLVVDQGKLYEGTGQYGHSSLRIVDLVTGRVELMTPLEQRFFGEGIAVLEGKIYQLTWKERNCIVYDQATLKPLNSFNYSGEGWGLTHDGRHLFMSDGSSTIRVLDPNTFRTIRKFRVKQGARSIDRLNELEFIQGEIFANVWQTDQIVRFSPEDGTVLGWLDLSNLYPLNQRASDQAVLNGIAYDDKNNRLFVTGKNWPNLFEVKIVSVPTIR
ncbi:MAG: glutaminyl-peptide cyclotransferase [Planctomycetales bacterium]|nr:glutaminyl-peptide cyclotransferase [Planctomycetales bacterium]